MSRETILVAGDTHANVGHLEYLYEVAADLGASRILQVGDFGFWPRHEFGRVFLDRVSDLAVATKIPLYWIDGNHEDHFALNALLDDGNCRGEAVEVRPDVWHLSRGHRWEWGGVRFAAFGGAYSVDRVPSVKGAHWFPEEVPSPADVDRLGFESVDVLVTHDTLSDVPVVSTLGWVPEKEHVVESERVRGLLSAVASFVRPELVLCGHWHQQLSYQADRRSPRVEVLAEDGTDWNSWGLLTVENGTFDFFGGGAVCWSQALGCDE